MTHNRSRRPLNAVPPLLLGKAAGTLNTMQQFGAVVGIAVVTAVFNAKGGLADPADVTSGYRPALGVAAGISVLGALVAFRIRRAKGNEAGEPQHLVLSQIESASPILEEV